MKGEEKEKVTTILLFSHFHAKHQSGLNQENHSVLQHNPSWPAKETSVQPITNHPYIFM